MKTLAIISQKGGTSKTTLCINLAIASELSGRPSVIFDLDPQSSSTSWKDSRDGDTPAVLSLHSARLSTYLDRARVNGASLAIIDTAPHSQKDALDAAQAADLILIPCKPSLVDLRTIASSLKIARLSEKPVVVVLTQTQARTSLNKDAAQAIHDFGIELAPVEIGSRLSFIHAFTLGKGVLETEPKSKASDEISLLHSFLIRKLRGDN